MGRPLPLFVVVSPSESLAYFLWGDVSDSCFLGAVGRPLPLLVTSPSDPDYSFFLEVAGRPLPLFYSAELDSLYLPTETDSFFFDVVGRPLGLLRASSELEAVFLGSDYSFFLLEDTGLPLLAGFSSELDTLSFYLLTSFYYFYSLDCSFYSFFLVDGRPLPLLASSSELVDELYSTLLDDDGLPLLLAP